MALPPLVTVADLADWLGESIEYEDARAGAVLRAASTLVRRETGRSWLTDPEDLTVLDESTPSIDADDLEVAQTVVKQVASRVWVNPTGVVHETTGPFSARYAEDAAQGLHLTATEAEMLSPYKTTARSGLHTIATTREDPVGITDLGIYDPATGTVYAEVTPPGAPLPFLDGPELA